MTNEHKPVTLPREVAEAIDRIVDDRVSCAYNIIAIRDNAINSPKSDYGTIWRWIMREKGINTIPDYFRALVNGYEIERTPAEKLIEYFRCATDDARAGVQVAVEYLSEDYPEFKEKYIDIIDPHRSCPDCGRDCVGWVAEGKSCGGERE